MPLFTGANDLEKIGAYDKQLQPDQNKQLVKQEITETSDFNVIHDAVQNLDPGTIVVFDIDEVLITPADQVISNKDFRTRNFKKIKQKLSEQKMILCESRAEIEAEKKS